MVEILGPLPARPPTPPRPGSRIDQNDPQSPHTLQTPGASSQTADASRVPPSSHGSKRVNFSPWLYTVIGSPKSQSTSIPKEAKPTTNTAFESPQGSEGRPFKSILKETSSPIPVWSPNVNRFTDESLDMLLESVVQQLAGESVSSRLDAYINFFGALRTYDGLLGGKEIGDKLGLITDFIQRDVTRDLVNGSPMDTSLANQALKLSAAFIWQPDISTLLSEDFKVFLVEHAITSLQETKGAKSVLTHHLSILSTQNFSPKIITTSRITRLLTALQDLSKHITGKAISFHRLSIYQRLLSQSKSTFLSNSSLWMEQLVFGLLHPHKDTRTKAISLGFQISVAAGPTPALSNNIRVLFERPLEGDRKLVTEIRERMSRMVASHDTGIHVPQIWSIIILLLRSKKWNLDQWEHFKEWVLVLQKCFNCSEPAIKAQAIVGWNRFIYAVSPNESTSRSLLKMLGKPVFSQFDRKKSDKPGLPPSQLALSSYYHLLYYAFRPSLPPHHLDTVWEEYVAAPSATIFSSFPALSDSAALVLANLLWCPQAKVWTETRITNTDKMEVEELPSVDSRWVRSKVSSVLAVFESLLKSSVWNQEAIEKSNIALAWNNLASALSLASSKEITPSGESMQAVASVLGLLHRLWATGASSLNATGIYFEDAFFKRFQFLSTTMILSLGGIPFTEKVMLKVGDGSFQTSNTPTHRLSTSGTNLDSPILHLLRTISRSTVVSLPTASYIQLMNGLIAAACNGRISRGSRLELLHQCAELSITELRSPSNLPHLLEVLWKGTAGAAADALRLFPIESTRERDGSVSRDYEIITKMLVGGVSFPGASQEWSQLLDAYVGVVRTEKGDRVLTDLVVEPLSESLATISVPNTYLLTNALLSQCISIPFARETGLEIENPVSQQVSLPAFPHKLMSTIRRTLELGYHAFDASHALLLSAFVESLASFLGSGTPSFRCQALETLQAALGLWIQDIEGKVDATRGVDGRPMTACRALSSAVLNILQTAVADEEASLQKFEAIICAGLESPHLLQTQGFVDFLKSTKTASDALISSTRIGQAFSTASARLSAPIQLPQTAVQEPKSVSSGLPKLAHHRASKQIAGKSPGTGSTNLNSSPLTGKNDPVLPNPAELGEPPLPMNPLAVPEVPAAFQTSRREMFRMIESIRSSSPANTPGKLGFNTPIHLRTLHAQSGIPLTPTLAPAENEEGFIASSPTPAHRDPTPAMNLEASRGNFQDITMEDATDMPSSPPEMTSRSPSPKKMSSSSRRARRRKLLQSSVAEEAKKKASTPQVDERPPGRRTRSTLTQSTANSQDADGVPASITISSTPAKSADKIPAPQSTNSKSSAKKRKRKGSLKSADGASQQTAQAPSTPVALEYFVDSSSEDLESQIASQLEQDLELAADVFNKNVSHSAPAAEAPQPVTKKRKREEDTVQSASPERRRSTRLSTAKDLGVINIDDTQSTQSQDAAISQPSRRASTSSLSPMVTRRSTRSSQKKDDESVIADSLPETQIPETIQEGPVKDSEPSQRPTKRSRKSLRLENQPVPPVEEHSSTRAKSSHSSRSRKSRSSRNERLSQPPPSQEQQLEAQAADAESELVPSSNDNREAVPEIITSEKPIESHLSLGSTEEATDSQRTDVDSSTAPVPEDIGKQRNVGLDMIPDQPSTSVGGAVIAFATPEVQAESVPPIVEPDISEAGISRSLKKLLADMKSAKLGPDALREVDDLLFNIRVEAHDASRRHNNLA
ncbi:Telomere length regulator protein rif1 [Penicillium rolfsii]|nr:Telomere length regulator protein rif1 [Penicillium rolfsii]